MVVIHKVQLQEVSSKRSNDDNYYVTVKILPQNHRSFQTKAVKKCKNLEFKEKFEFRVAYEKLQAQSLKMTLCCFDRFSQHEPLGDHTVHLADLEARGLSLSREILLFRGIQTVQKVDSYSSLVGWSMKHGFNSKCVQLLVPSFVDGLNVKTQLKINHVHPTSG